MGIELSPDLLVKAICMIRRQVRRRQARASFYQDGEGGPRTPREAAQKKNHVRIRSHQLQIRYQLCCVYFEQAPHETQQESHS